MTPVATQRIKKDRLEGEQGKCSRELQYPNIVVILEARLWLTGRKSLHFPNQVPRQHADKRRSSYRETRQDI